MAKKFYAVKAGRTPGVYDTWSECEKQVKGYSGAIYKSFSTKQEAMDFIGSAEKVQAKGTNEKLVAPYFESAEKIELNTQSLVAYIDGSFDKTTKTVGSGGIIFYNNQMEEFSFGTSEEKYTQFWNVAGELLAAMYVTEKAIEKEAPSCELYYDYMGIEMWATKAWKANNELTKMYAGYMQDAMKHIHIEFHKVAAHTGVAYNERADELAKAGTKKR